MKSAILSLFLAVATAVAIPFNETETVAFRCGTEIAPEDIAAAEAHFEKYKVPPSDKAATISVYFHVVSQDSTAAGGNIPDSQIASQMQALNTGFSNTGISFRLAGTTRTVNTNWFTRAGPNTPEVTTMKNTLYTGNAATLNIYTAGTLTTSDGQGLAGYAYFPSQGVGKLDGVVMNFKYLSGGPYQGYNLGRIVTHEVGHWVGLYHTFEGGCSGNGDFVSDTPAEASPASGCPAGRDTCGGAGSDPINNFMDYTDDNCRTQFTAGQITRMKQQISTYRNIVV